MIGPQIHLNAYGSVVIASAAPTAAGSSPRFVRYGGSVYAMNPHGIPWAA